MAETAAAPRWENALVALAVTVIGVVVVGVLYWAQVVLIPVALALFLAFLLNPLVRAVQRTGLGRVPSVLLVVLFTALLLTGLGWLVARQVTGLLAELPNYTTNIKAKIKTLRELGSGSGTEGLEKMVEEVGGVLKPRPSTQDGKTPGKPAEGSAAPAGQPPAVVVQPKSPAWLARLPAYLGSVLGTVGGLALALVLVVFMLLGREDLRNRFLRLVGRQRMLSTTRAVNEAAQRISRYLLMQAIVNGTYGLALAIGLSLIGVEYALLWGFLAAVLRYVPYVGPWVAALFPLTLSLAMSEGWWQPLAVFGLVLALELVSNNVMEPRLYGQSMGVSEVALLIAAAFWAFLWGPVGLVLSAPLTVCLVVLGHYVPRLEFLAVLLGDEPALGPDVSYYQRLLARDQDEAAELVLAHGNALPQEELYDALLVPALNYALRDRQRDELSEADEQFILWATREVLKDLGERQATTTAAGAAAGAEAPPRVRVLVCPARDEADELALEMLRQLLDPARWEVKAAAAETLTSEVVAQAAEEAPRLILIGALPPGGLAQTRYLCKRLRARFPQVKILVGRWGLSTGLEANQERLREAGADVMTTSLLEARNQMNGWLPVLAHGTAPAPAGGAAEGRQKVAG